MPSLINWFSKATPSGLIILSLIVGIGGAIGAALFHSLIYISTLVFFGYDGSGDFITTVESIPSWQRVLIPTIGGLLVGLLFALAKVSEAEGEGVPEVMEALEVRKGTIRPLVAPVKIITAAITIGSGGSAGREGPVIQIGSAIGSSIAQFTKQAASERSLLLAAGAAAGIGGTFGAPIAGVLFTIEILHHRSISLLRAMVIVLAAFVGTYATYLLTGHNGLRFISTATPEISFLNILILFALGIVSALTALLFGQILTASRLVFKKIPLPHYGKPALGGFMIGIMALFLPYIHEPAAYPLMVDLIALTSLPFGFLCILFIVKMIATGITLGSGGSGGIFAPMLLMGAIVGSLIGSILLFFSLINPTTVPLLVIFGMAAVFASAAHAPLTASFITYEMTEDIRLLIPLLIICALATFVAKRLKKESIYHADQTN